MSNQGLGGLKIILFLGAAAALYFGGSAYYKTALKQSPSKGAEVKKFVVEQGENVAQIAQRLEDEGLIKSSNLLKIYLKINDLAGSIQAGEYEIPGNLNLIDLVKMLRHGSFAKKVTIIEGLRQEEIAEVFEKEMGIESEKFLEASKGLEGKLFPETYYFEKTATAEDVVAKLKATFDKKLTPEIIQAGEKSGLTAEELLTLASIVERESNSEGDRPIVAGILLKRLQKDWPLQADATLQYALGKEGNWWPKDLTVDDLKSKSPYNTRESLGLPPTPICNPSLDSLEATANSVETVYWYYLTGKDGRMRYAETLDKHNQNITSYL